MIFRALTYVAIGVALSSLARALDMDTYTHFAFLVSAAWVVGVVVSKAMED